MESEIQRTVDWLEQQGFSVVEIDNEESTTRLSMTVEPANLVVDADSLCQVLQDRGVSLNVVGAEPPYLQASYDPTSGIAMLDLVLEDGC